MSKIKHFTFEVELVNKTMGVTQKVVVSAIDESLAIAKMLQIYKGSDLEVISYHVVDVNDR